jgi:hypothetical protein
MGSRPTSVTGSVYYGRSAEVSRASSHMAFELFDRIPDSFGLGVYRETTNTQISEELQRNISLIPR